MQSSKGKSSKSLWSYCNYSLAAWPIFVPFLKGKRKKEKKGNKKTVLKLFLSVMLSYNFTVHSQSTYLCKIPTEFKKFTCSCSLNARIWAGHSRHVNGKRLRTAHIFNNSKADEITSDVWKKQWKEVSWKPPSLPCWHELCWKTSLTKTGQQGNYWSRTKAVKSQPKENKDTFKHTPLQVCIHKAVPPGDGNATRQPARETHRHVTSARQTRNTKVQAGRMESWIARLTCFTAPWTCPVHLQSMAKKT